MHCIHDLTGEFLCFLLLSAIFKGSRTSEEILKIEEIVILKKDNDNQKFGTKME